MAKKARQQQSEALARWREKAEAADAIREEAACLREENKRLTNELVRQKTFFEKIIDGLKEQLKAALAMVDKLTDQISALKDEIRTLRTRFLPTPDGRHPKPSAAPSTQRRKS